jgi:catechol 2,3-dioxygenase-like lactoylglutathione lyase family enzyme
MQILLVHGALRAMLVSSSREDTMGFHHVAIATRDVAATHAFYTDVMGFDLVKVDAIPTDGGGWARHLFYDTHGSGLLAFWDIHDDANVPAEFDPSISRGLGLPAYTNHIAFDAGDLAGIQEHIRRALDHRQDVVEIDHGWCTSIYLNDPNGILVEFCATTRELTAADRENAQRLLAMTDRPSLADVPDIIVHEAEKSPAATA